MSTAELTPVPPAVTTKELAPPETVTSPMVSDVLVCARPNSVNVPPARVIAVASRRRSLLFFALLALSSVREPKFTVRPVVAVNAASSVSVRVPPLTKVSCA